MEGGGKGRERERAERKGGGKEWEWEEREEREGVGRGGEAGRAAGKERRKRIADAGAGGEVERGMRRSRHDAPRDSISLIHRLLPHPIPRPGPPAPATPHCRTMRVCWFSVGPSSTRRRANCPWRQMRWAVGGWEVGREEQGGEEGKGQGRVYGLELATRSHRSQTWRYNYTP